MANNVELFGGFVVLVLVSNNLGIMRGKGMVSDAGGVVAVAPDRSSSPSGTPSPASLGT